MMQLLAAFHPVSSQSTRRKHIDDLLQMLSMVYVSGTRSVNALPCIRYVCIMSIFTYRLLQLLTYFIEHDDGIDPVLVDHFASNVLLRGKSMDRLYVESGVVSRDQSLSASVDDIVYYETTSSDIHGDQDRARGLLELASVPYRQTYTTILSLITLTQRTIADEQSPALLMLRQSVMRLLRCVSPPASLVSDLIGHTVPPNGIHWSRSPTTPAISASNRSLRKLVEIFGINGLLGALYMSHEILTGRLCVSGGVSHGMYMLLLLLYTDFLCEIMMCILDIDICTEEMQGVVNYIVWMSFDLIELCLLQGDSQAILRRLLDEKGTRCHFICYL